VPAAEAVPRSVPGARSAAAPSKFSAVLGRMRSGKRRARGPARSGALGKEVERVPHPVSLLRRQAERNASRTYGFEGRRTRRRRPPASGRARARRAGRESSQTSRPGSPSRGPPCSLAVAIVRLPGNQPVEHALDVGDHVGIVAFVDGDRRGRVGNVGVEQSRRPGGCGRLRRGCGGRAVRTRFGRGSRRSARPDPHPRQRASTRLGASVSTRGAFPPAGISVKGTSVTLEGSTRIAFRREPHPHAPKRVSGPRPGASRP
jgi:hypothetical protein